MLFSLDNDQAINLSVTFKAPSEGLHTNHVFLLCANTSLKRVDFTGDGFLYNPSWIHPMVSKTFIIVWFYKFWQYSTWFTNKFWMKNWKVDGANCLKISLIWELKFIFVHFVSFAENFGKFVVNEHVV